MEGELNSKSFFQSKQPSHENWVVNLELRTGSIFLLVLVQLVQSCYGIIRPSLTSVGT